MLLIDNIARAAYEAWRKKIVESGFSRRDYAEANWTELAEYERMAWIAVVQKTIDLVQAVMLA